MEQKDSKQIGDAALTLYKKEISIIKTKKLPKIGSKIVFMSDDEDDNEVTDGEVIEGESEQIFQSSGVRGNMSHTSDKLKEIIDAQIKKDNIEGLKVNSILALYKSGDERAKS